MYRLLFLAVVPLRFDDGRVEALAYLGGNGKGRVFVAGHGIGLVFLQQIALDIFQGEADLLAGKDLVKVQEL